MSAMTNTSASQPDLLGGIFERLNGAIAQVSNLRQPLGDLEIELIGIRRQCENARVAASSSKAHNEDGTALRGRPVPVPVPRQSSEKAQDPIWAERKLRRNQREREDRRNETPTSGRKGDPKSNPVTTISELFKKSEQESHSTLLSPSPGVSSSSLIPESPGSPPEHVVKARKSLEVSHLQFRTTPAQPQVAPEPQHKHAKRPPMPSQIPLRPPPRPPTQPSPFPENVDWSSYPPELKHEGDNWLLLYNRSPKVKRVLNVNLVHTIMHDSEVWCAKFSRDGKWLATGCRRMAQIFDVETGIRICVLDHENDEDIINLCFSPDKKYLATAGDDNQILVWDIANQQIYNILKGHQRTVWHFQFLPDGQHIVSGSDDGTIRIWNVHDRTFRVLTIDGHYLSPDHRVFSVDFSPDGRYIAAGSVDTVVSIWEVTTGVLVQTLRGHTRGVESVAFVPDGKGLISGSWDATLKYWDVSGLGIGSSASTALTSTSGITSSPCFMNLTGHKGAISSITVSHDGAWVVSGSEDGNVLFWDTKTGMAQCMLLGHPSVVLVGVDLSPMADFLATAAWDGKVRIWSYGVSR